MGISIRPRHRRVGGRRGGAYGRPLVFPRLRFHDLRHHAITELAESQASDATIMAIAGHVSRQMLEHYSHVRLDLKRKALEALSTQRGNSEGKPAGYDTNHDTKPGSTGAEGDASYWKEWSGREDLNLRPPGPEPGALPG